jgi:acyl carrier protein
MNNYLSDKDAQTVLDILSEELGVPREQIKGEARIMEDLGADSLTVIEITMALEERFNATMPDERLERVKTVAELCEALAEAIYPEARRTGS